VRKGLRFLTPANPQETLALVVLCTVLLGIGGGVVRAYERLTAEDPWNARADRVCLDAGSEYLDAKGNPVERLRIQIEVTARALTDLRAVRSAVPISSTLSFGTMLSDKAEVLKLFRRKLHLMEESLPIENVQSRIRSAFEYGYAQEAEELGLYVCGQGTGQQ
jgi:hypothetical protein